MTSRVLVTGAAGFIGSHLCRRLVAEGYAVVGHDDLSDGSLDNLAGTPEVSLCEGDLRDAESVSEAARGCETIFHLGGKRSVARSVDEPRLTTGVNVVGTLNVLLAARDAGAAVVCASSSSVYGDQRDFPLVETMTPAPRSPYATSKLASEIYCRGIGESFGIPNIALRYFNVYGPGQDPESPYAAVVPAFVRACLEGSQPTMHGNGEQARDFTYVEDVVEANLLAARAARRTPGTVCNVGGGAAPTSIDQLLSLIAVSVGVTALPMNAAPRVGDVFRTHADLERARSVLGYEPAVPIEEGIGRTVEWFRSRRRSTDPRRERPLATR